MIQAAKIIGTGLATTGLIGAGIRIGLVFNRLSTFICYYICAYNGIITFVRSSIGATASRRNLILLQRRTLFTYVVMVLAYVILGFAFLKGTELLNAGIVFGAPFLGYELISDNVSVNYAILITVCTGKYRRHFSSSCPDRSDSDNSLSPSSSSDGEIDPTDATKLDRTQHIADRYRGDKEGIEKYFKEKGESLREAHRIDSNNAAIDGANAGELSQWREDYDNQVEELYLQEIDAKLLASIPVTPDPSSNLLGDNQEGDIEPVFPDSHPTNEEAMEEWWSNSQASDLESMSGLSPKEDNSEVVEPSPSQDPTSHPVVISTDQGGTTIPADIPVGDVAKPGPSRKRRLDEEDQESSPVEAKRFKQDSSDVVQTEFDSYGWDSED